VIKSDSVFEDMFAELMTILHLASGAPPSPALGKGKIATKQSHCPPQVPSTKCQKPKFSSCG
ncbi:hypothetical protein, partial [Burkholderia multivorans]|uniref:hypothetical protein n=1 Tax=Burkholderia multivorans TaxID=87883 RepID=UPI0021BE0793